MIKIFLHMVIFFCYDILSYRQWLSVDGILQGRKREKEEIGRRQCVAKECLCLRFIAGLRS